METPTYSEDVIFNNKTLYPYLLRPPLRAPYSHVWSFLIIELTELLAYRYTYNELLKLRLLSHWFNSVINEQIRKGPTNSIYIMFRHIQCYFVCSNCRHWWPMGLQWTVSHDNIDRRMTNICRFCLTQRIFSYMYPYSPHFRWTEIKQQINTRKNGVRIEIHRNYYLNLKQLALKGSATSYTTGTDLERKQQYAVRGLISKQGGFYLCPLLVENYDNYYESPIFWQCAAETVPYVPNSDQWMKWRKRCHTTVSDIAKQFSDFKTKTNIYGKALYSPNDYACYHGHLMEHYVKLFLPLMRRDVFFYTQSMPVEANINDVVIACTPDLVCSRELKSTHFKLVVEVKSFENMIPPDLKFQHYVQVQLQMRSLYAGSALMAQIGRNGDQFYFQLKNIYIDDDMLDSIIRAKFKISKEKLASYYVHTKKWDKADYLSW